MLAAIANGEYISIHAPHARSDAYWIKYNAIHEQFQSTLLMRGATC